MQLRYNSHSTSGRSNRRPSNTLSRSPQELLLVQSNSCTNTPMILQSRSTDSQLDVVAITNYHTENYKQEQQRMGTTTTTIPTNTSTIKVPCQNHDGSSNNNKETSDGTNKVPSFFSRTKPLQQQQPATSFVTQLHELSESSMSSSTSLSSTNDTRSSLQSTAPTPISTTKTIKIRRNQDIYRTIPTSEPECSTIKRSRISCENNSSDDDENDPNDSADCCFLTWNSKSSTENDLWIQRSYAFDEDDDDDHDDNDDYTHEQKEYDYITSIRIM